MVENESGIRLGTWGAGSGLRIPFEDRMSLCESGGVGSRAVVRSNSGMQGEADMSDAEVFY